MIEFVDPPRTVGVTSEATVQLDNLSGVINAGLSVTSASIEGGGGQFALTTPLPLLLQPNGRAVLSVEFTPNSIGSSEAVLVLETDIAEHCPLPKRRFEVRIRGLAKRVCERCTYVPPTPVCAETSTPQRSIKRYSPTGVMCDEDEDTCEYEVVDDEPCPSGCDVDTGLCYSNPPVPNLTRFRIVGGAVRSESNRHSAWLVAPTYPVQHTTENEQYRVSGLTASVRREP